MLKLKLTAAAAVATTLASLPAAPPAVAGPWLAPWALGHVIGAAARLATLPIVIASAASSATQPPPPVTPAPYSMGYAPPPFAPPGYYGSPAYYAPPPTYYSGPVFYPGGGQRYYSTSAYRMPVPYLGGVRMPESFQRYSVAGMRYSGAYGEGFSRSRGFAHRRW
jgi:hypothetical protein